MALCFPVLIQCRISFFNCLQNLRRYIKHIHVHVFKASKDFYFNYFNLFKVVLEVRFHIFLT